MVGKPWYEGDCVLCKEGCCNNDLHDMLNSLVSWEYVGRQVKKIDEKLGERMLQDIARFDKALKNCKRRADD